MPRDVVDLWQTLGFKCQPQGLGLNPTKDLAKKGDQDEMSDWSKITTHKDIVYGIT